MVWQGKHAVMIGRALIGATVPSSSAPGTLRGDYALEITRNVIHGSDSVESAEREVGLWFSKDELQEYIHHHQPWVFGENDK